MDRVIVTNDGRTNEMDGKTSQKTIQPMDKMAFTGVALFPHATLFKYPGSAEILQLAKSGGKV